VIAVHQKRVKRKYCVGDANEYHGENTHRHHVSQVVHLNPMEQQRTTGDAQPENPQRIDYALPPPIPSQCPPVVDRRLAWNPHWIGLLGLAFSPIWVGVMTAINGHRLGLNYLWRPLAIGIGVAVIDIVMPFNSILISLCLYVGALIAIWKLDLAPQLELMGQQSGCNTASLLVPSLIGLPLALVVFMGFVVAPLIPAFPRDVCQSFLDAKTTRVARRYVAAEMEVLLEHQRRIEAAAKNLKPGEQPIIRNDMFQLTDEGYAPEEYGGYLVGWHCGLPMPDGSIDPAEGVFHLTNDSGSWKIMGWHAIESYADDQPVQVFDLTELWNKVATKVERLAKSDTNPTVEASNQAMFGNSSSAGKQDWVKQLRLARHGTRLTRSGIAKLFGSKSFKGVGLLFLGLLAGMYKLLTSKPVSNRSR
jgi:hypothetical protein